MRNFTELFLTQALQKKSILEGEGVLNYTRDSRDETGNEEKRERLATTCNKDPWSGLNSGDVTITYSVSRIKFTQKGPWGELILHAEIPRFYTKRKHYKSIQSYIREQTSACLIT